MGAPKPTSVTGKKITPATERPAHLGTYHPVIETPAVTPPPQGPEELPTFSINPPPTPEDVARLEVELNTKIESLPSKKEHIKLWRDARRQLYQERVQTFRSSPEYAARVEESQLTYEKTYQDLVAAERKKAEEIIAGLPKTIEEAAELAGDEAATAAGKKIITAAGKEARRYAKELGLTTDEIKIHVEQAKSQAAATIGTDESVVAARTAAQSARLKQPFTAPKIEDYFPNSDKFVLVETRGVSRNRFYRVTDKPLSINSQNESIVYPMPTAADVADPIIASPSELAKQLRHGLEGAETTSQKLAFSAMSESEIAGRAGQHVETGNFTVRDVKTGSLQQIKFNEKGILQTPRVAQGEHLANDTMAVKGLKSDIARYEERVKHFMRVKENLLANPRAGASAIDSLNATEADLTETAARLLDETNNLISTMESSGVRNPGGLPSLKRIRDEWVSPDFTVTPRSASGSIDILRPIPPEAPPTRGENAIATARNRYGRTPAADYDVERWTIEMRLNQPPPPNMSAQQLATYNQQRSKMIERYNELTERLSDISARQSMPDSYVYINGNWVQKKVVHPEIPSTAAKYDAEVGKVPERTVQLARPHTDGSVERIPATFDLNGNFQPRFTAGVNPGESPSFNDVVYAREKNIEEWRWVINQLEVHVRRYPGDIVSAERLRSSRSALKSYIESTSKYKTTIYEELHLSDRRFTVKDTLASNANSKVTIQFQENGVLRLNEQSPARFADAEDALVWEYNQYVVELNAAKTNLTASGQADQIDVQGWFDKTEDYIRSLRTRIPSDLHDRLFAASATAKPTSGKKLSRYEQALAQALKDQPNLGTPIEPSTPIGPADELIEMGEGSGMYEILMGQIDDTTKKLLDDLPSEQTDDILQQYLEGGISLARFQKKIADLAQRGKS